MKLPRPTVALAAAVAAAAAFAARAPALHAQSSGQKRFEFGGLPAVKFDSDEGFGYGAIVELYEYGTPEQAPYVWTLQPKVFLTTQGRRDLTAFFDAPYLLSGGWRLSAFVGTEKQIASPFYGVGNATVYDESLDDPDGLNPAYYRFGRTRNSATFTLQRRIRDLPVRMLLGGGVERTGVQSVPDGSMTSLYAEQILLGEETTWTNYVQGGVVYDTRDRETGPTSGTWTELLVRWTDESLGADFDYTRWTFADRRYFSLTDRLVFANRFVLQDVSEGAPVYELSRLQTSFKQQEGLGGSKTVRGILKDRYTGRGMVVWNAELRWRVKDFSMVGRPFHLVLSTFFDQGRVWADGLEMGEILNDLHRGYGGGVRVGMGENLVGAIDVGTTSGGGTPLYMGLGYLF